jgi:hypothetical protein
MEYLLKAKTLKPVDGAIANMSVARQQLHNTQQQSNWEAVFSTQFVPIAT